MAKQHILSIERGTISCEVCLQLQLPDDKVNPKLSAPCQGSPYHDDGIKIKRSKSTELQNKYPMLKSYPTVKLARRARGATYGHKQWPKEWALPGDDDERSE